MGLFGVSFQRVPITHEAAADSAAQDKVCTGAPRRIGYLAHKCKIANSSSDRFFKETSIPPHQKPPYSHHYAWCPLFEPQRITTTSVLLVMAIRGGAGIRMPSSLLSSLPSSEAPPPLAARTTVVVMAAAVVAVTRAL